eukprot:705531_1
MNNAPAAYKAVQMMHSNSPEHKNRKKKYSEPLSLFTNDDDDMDLKPLGASVNPLQDLSADDTSTNSMGFQQEQPSLPTEFCKICHHRISWTFPQSHNKKAHIDCLLQPLQNPLRKNHCYQDAIYKELGLVTDEEDSIGLCFTDESLTNVLYSVIFDPITWLFIPLFGYPYLLGFFFAFVVFSVVTVIWLRVRKYEPQFGIAREHHLRRIFYSKLVIHFLLSIEIGRLYLYQQTNIVHTCHVDEYGDEDGDGVIDVNEPDVGCMVYLHLLGVAFVIFLSGIYMNIATMRKIKTSVLQNLVYDNNSQAWKIVDKYTGHPRIETLLKDAFAKIEVLLYDDIHEEGFSWRELWYSLERNVCGGAIRDHDGCCKCGCRPNFKHMCNLNFMWDFFLGLGVFIIGVILSFSTFICHPELLPDKISDQWWQGIPVITSILQCISMNAMLCTTLYKVKFVYYRAYAAMHLLSSDTLLQSNRFGDNMAIKDIEAWFDLHVFITENIVPLFYELVNPILATEILSLIVFSASIIYQLLVTFEGDVGAYVNSLLSDNIRFIVFVFTILLIFVNMITLKWALKPYEVQKCHMEQLQLQMAWLKFGKEKEENTSDKAKIGSVIAVLQYLISEMKSNVKSPQLLGVQLTETKLIAIRGYIVTVVGIFLGSTFSQYLNTYDQLAT